MSETYSKEDVEKLLAEAKAAAKKEYDADAHKFREWINTHEAIWAARRFGAAGALFGAVFGWWVHGLAIALKLI